MFRRARLILATLALLLGVAHIIFGFAVFKTFNLESFWFTGFGLGLIVAALANFRRDKIWILRAQNTLTLGFLIALLTLAPEPQIWLGCLLFAGLLLLSFRQEASKA